MHSNGSLLCTLALVNNQHEAMTYFLALRRLLFVAYMAMGRVVSSPYPERLVCCVGSWTKLLANTVSTRVCLYLCRLVCMRVDVKRVRALKREMRE
jgi:hypothetical protein